MKYTQEERLDIGKRIYDGEISKSEAAAEYGIHEATARDYMRLYRDTNNLPPKTQKRRKKMFAAMPNKPAAEPEEYESMTKEELIRELLRAKIREARLKKGYEVKGAGADKVFILLGSKNTK